MVGSAAGVGWSKFFPPSGVDRAPADFSHCQNTLIFLRARAIEKTLGIQGKIGLEASAMRRGRPPKSTRLHLLHGTFRRDRHGQRADAPRAFKTDAELTP